MTNERRAAIGECMGIVTLLVEAKTPHAKDLALIVLKRAESLIDGEGDPLISDDDAVQAVSMLIHMLGGRPRVVQ